MLDFFRNLFRTAEQVVTADDRFNSASALSAYALSTFDRIVDDLTEASSELDTVVDEVSADIARIQAEAVAKVAHLQQVADAAMTQRLQNTQVIVNVKRLVGAEA